MPKERHHARSLSDRLPGKAKLTHWVESLRVSWWLLPLLCVIAAIGLSFGVDALDGLVQDRDSQPFYLFEGGPQAAREILGVIASSTMTFTGLVFSVTILVLQLASSQFSPRALRTFLKDRKSQLVLGLFVSTFVYALLGLRSIEPLPDADEPKVASLTVWLGIILAIGCVLAFIFYLHHIAQSIRVVVVIEKIGDDARKSLKKLFPEGIGEDCEDPVVDRPSGTPTLVVPYLGTSGVVDTLDGDQVFRCAVEARVTVAQVPLLGDFVPYGGPLFEVWGDASKLDLEALVSSVSIGTERSIAQDTLFAIRQLVDIAERALSPGVNDPTTAVQAIDQIHDILRRLALRRFPAPCRLDGGRLSALLPRPDFDSYVRLAVDELRQFGGGSIQVMRRLRFLLEDLLRAAPQFRRVEVLRQLRLLDRSIEREFSDPEDREVARQPSAQGHGPAN